jgi:hypothetical protein
VRKWLWLGATVVAAAVVAATASAAPGVWLVKTIGGYRDAISAVSGDGGPALSRRGWRRRGSLST